MYLKHRYRLGYELLVQGVTDSLHWRRFCHLGLATPVPHPTLRELEEAGIARLSLGPGPDVGIADRDEEHLGAAPERTALATEEHLQLRRRHCLQGLAGRTSLKQRQLHRPIGIHEQSQELREVGLPATRQVITEHGPSAHQVGAVPGERPQLMSDFRVRQQGTIQGRAFRFQWEIF